MATAGRPLDPRVYGAILAGLGFDVSDPVTLQAALANVFATGMFPTPDGGYVPGIGGYAVGYVSTAFGTPLISLAGFDLQQAHLVTEAIDYGNPDVTADQVVDRRTLKKFVISASGYLTDFVTSGDLSAVAKVKIALRDANGPWRHGPVYLFIMDDNGYTIFHGAFPDRFELSVPTTTLRDAVTDELILPQIITAATSSPEGGFVEYHFDNPDDDSDSAEVPKVTYARQITFEVPLPDGTTLVERLIIGAGIYGDPVSQESTASVQGWLARFGRAVASHAVDAVDARMTSPPPSGSRLTLGGQNVLFGDASAVIGDDRFAQWSGQSPLALPRNRSLTRGRQMSLSDLLMGSSFQLASANGAQEASGGYWTAWGGAARTSFGGSEGGSSLDGDVVTAMLGVDYEWNRVMAGVVLSRTEGDGGFDFDGRSDMNASLTSVHPYVRVALSERFSAWAMPGMGWGDMSLTEDVIDKSVATDIGMTMGAFGVRGALLSAPRTGGFALAVKSDALFTQIDTDEANGLESIEAKTRRIRLTLEGSRLIAFDSGGGLRPSLEVGLRHDGGDAEEGGGLEIGGRVRFTRPSLGLTVEGNGRGLIAHQESEASEWGVGGLIRLALGSEGRGLAFTVQPTVGDDASGMARLWEQLQDASRRARRAVDLEPRVRAEMSYGRDALGGLLTPYAGLALSEGRAAAYRMGWRLKVRESVSVRLEGGRRESFNHGTASQGVPLGGPCASPGGPCGFDKASYAVSLNVTLRL